jgi:21S rRNA (uridine2791-2'-O)-methyltransferase
MIPAQPPKGVSTIQGNFLSKAVQEEVKRFLSDPDRGRPRDQLTRHDDDPSQVDLTNDTDLERQGGAAQDISSNSDSGVIGSKSRTEVEGMPKMVDVVLSDMCAPWEQTTGFWKKSLSGPYNRMMNTSGINFKDHAGSMVCSQLSRSCH